MRVATQSEDVKERVRDSLREIPQWAADEGLGMTAGKLAAELQLPEEAVEDALEELEAAGFVDSDLEDFPGGRDMIFEITALGRHGVCRL